MIKKIFYLAALFLAALNLRPIITSVASMMSMIQSDLGVSALTASLLTTLPVLCMGVFAPVATKLSRRFGLERTLFSQFFLSQLRLDCVVQVKRLPSFLRLLLQEELELVLPDHCCLVLLKSISRKVLGLSVCTLYR